MSIKDLSELVSFASTATGETTDPTHKAYYAGMVQAFSFILAEETHTRQRVERLAYGMQYGNRAATAKCGKVPA